MPVSNWSTTAASNGSTLGIDIAENCDAANINNALREMMAQLRTKLDAMDVLIGDGSLDATLTALAGLTTAANQLIYSTGVDAFAMTTLSTFARTLIDDGDAATARTTLGALGLTTATFGANSVLVKITLGNGDTLMIQGGTGTLGADTTGTVTFPTAYSIAPVCVVVGGSSSVADNGEVHTSAAPTTTGVAICNSNGDLACNYNWIAIGKA